MAEAAADRQVRALITPEGVDLRVRLATLGERAAALMIDLAIMFVCVMAALFLTLGALWQLHLDRNSRTGPEIVAIIWLLFFFVLRNFYFTIMECSPRAATWGKRALGLRVVARDGGALSADAVVTRNAMREIELYLPIIAILLSAFAGADEIGAFIVFSAIVWCAIFVLFPVFNRDKLRVGDLVAGTWVIKTPKQKLLPDLAGETKADVRFVFTDAQLGVYGVKELQVLESVLRGDDGEVMIAVADRIRSKINWSRTPHESDAEFLNAYYAGLRRRLEQKLLLGVRKKDKFDRN
ncbi:MAG TPA: RDD family protein [Caulobacterales bacterium]|nr:RDD family protein [Caulobacterales bacterium]